MIRIVKTVSTYSYNNFFKGGFKVRLVAEKLNKEICVYMEEFKNPIDLPTYRPRKY